MFEHIKFADLTPKINFETIEEIKKRWPKLDYQNGTLHDVLRELNTMTVASLYETALNINFVTLAIITTEELIRRDQEYDRYRYRNDNPDINIIRDIVVKKLQQAFDRHQIVRGGNLINTLGFTLLDRCYDFDHILAKYGQELSRGLVFMGPEEWFAETIQNSQCTPKIAYETPWTKALLAS